MSQKMNLVADVDLPNNPYMVKIVNRSRWAQLDQTVYYTFGGQLTIPIEFRDGSDYTCIQSSDGTITPDGNLELSVFGDITVTLTNAKVRLGVKNLDEDAVGDVTYQGISIIDNHVFVQRLVQITLTVTYKSSYDYTGTVSDLGKLTSNGLEIIPTDINETVTLRPKSFIMQLCNGVPWCTTETEVSTCRYGKTWQRTLSFSDSANYSTVAANGQALSGNTIYANNVTSNTIITLTPATCQVKPTLNTTIVNSVSPSVRYAPFNGSTTFTVYMKSPFTTSDVSTNIGTISGSTLTVPTTSDIITPVYLSDNLTYTTIGNAEQSIDNVPDKTNYKYSHAQMIYTSDEIRKSGTIRGIAFLVNNSPTSTRTLRVYATTVSRSEFTSSSDFTTFSASYYNFYGTVVWKTGWVFIPFSGRTLSYDSARNLLICVNDITGSSHYYGPTFSGYSSSGAPYQSLFTYDNYSSYDPSYTYNGTRRTSKPMIRLNFA